MAPANPPKRLENLIDRILEISAAESVDVRTVVQSFGRTSFLPLLAVPALIVVTPLSGIPLLSSTCGLIIALVGMQMAVRRDSLWLPGVLSRQAISGARLGRAIERARGPARWIDRHSRDRLTVLFREPFVTVSRILCASCGAVMPLLELVPFTSSILAAAVLSFCVGFLARDGLYIVVATAMIAAAASIPITLIF